MEQNSENIDINLNVSSGTGSTGNSGTVLTPKKEVVGWEAIKKWLGFPSEPNQA